MNLNVTSPDKQKHMWKCGEEYVKSSRLDNLCKQGARLFVMEALHVTQTASFLTKVQSLCMFGVLHFTILIHLRPKLYHNNCINNKDRYERRRRPVIKQSQNHQNHQRTRSNPLLRATREVTLDILRVMKAIDPSDITITSILLERFARTLGETAPSEVILFIKLSELVHTIIEVDLAAEGPFFDDGEGPRETFDEEGIPLGHEAAVRLAFSFVLFVIYFGLEAGVAFAVHDDRALVDFCIVSGDGVHIVSIDVEWEMHTVPQLRHVELVLILEAVLRLATVSNIPDFS